MATATAHRPRQAVPTQAPHPQHLTNPVARPAAPRASTDTPHLHHRVHTQALHLTSRVTEEVPIRATHRRAVQARATVLLPLNKANTKAAAMDNRLVTAAPAVTEPQVEAVMADILHNNMVKDSKDSTARAHHRTNTVPPHRTRATTSTSTINMEEHLSSSKEATVVHLITVMAANRATVERLHNMGKVVMVAPRNQAGRSMAVPKIRMWYLSKYCARRG